MKEPQASSHDLNDARASVDPAVLDAVSQRRRAVLDAIAAAARDGGRDPAAIVLTAVSKKQPDDRVDAMLALGHRVFGENRVQEAQMRWASRRAMGPELELRLIGPLQTNKVRDAVALFDVIESVDRDKLAAALAREMERTGRALRLYVQVNTGEEPQKSGVLPGEADAFVARMRSEYGLSVEGLMAIPPADEEPALHFALLADIANRNGLTRLSMGMSEDFETAVRHGSTAVRVGSALFGRRPDV